MDFLTFLTTFGILFLAEIGDKTQLVVFNLTLKFKESWKVGFGATLGFAVIVTIGVYIGVIIEGFVPPRILNYISGAIFLILGIREIISLRGEWRDHMKNQEGGASVEIREEGEEKEAIAKHKRLQKNPILAGFGFIFLMELGDKTQLMTISLASGSSSILEIWLGAFLALSSLAWVGAFFGGVIAKKVPKFYIEAISASLFCIIGLLLVLSPA
ncbi:MAG: hypothetical protein RBG13Loki_3871 [Promethearchaeota archaeon CR_4]|nr:MAG: hypothetical protein RBG13Loki_3871 [Candidatus Lokiarchaeota archaeon CR_4]